jgi:hypothetical protein
MQVGARVIVKNAKDTWNLGIATEVHDSAVTVLYDDGKTTSVSLSRISVCLYFAAWVKSPVKQEWMDKYAKRIRPNDYDMKKYFTLKKPGICSLPLLTCMWYWLNHYVFHSKLTLPALKTSTPKQTQSGLYQYRKTGDTICISARSNVVIYEVFDRLGHEMVHQFNYRLDWLKDGTFDPASGGHGRSFMRWKGPLKEIAGINLTMLHDMAGTDVDSGDAVKEQEEVETDTSKGKAFSNYILLVAAPAGPITKYYATKSKDLDKIQSAKTAIRGKLGMTSKYMTRKLSNVPLLNAITTVNKGSVHGAVKVVGYFFSLLPESIFNAVVKAAEPGE